MKSSSALHAPQVNSRKTGVDAMPIACRATLAAAQCQANGGRPVGNRQLCAVLRGASRGAMSRDPGVAAGAFVLTKTGSRRATSRLSSPCRTRGSSGHRIDVVRLDALDDLVVQVDGLFVRQAQQDVPEAGVGIAAVAA